MSGALALRDGQEWWDERQQAALAQIGVGDAPRGDQAVFLHVCQRTGLDPFARQIHLIGRWDARSKGQRYTIQVGIDGLRVIAQRTGLYQGRLGPWWCGADGAWSDVWLGDGPPVAARAGVVRSDHAQPTYAVALMSEYVQAKDGRPVALWASKPAHMLGKVAEALALRAAFPQDMAGLYTDDEMAAADHVPRPAAVQQSEPMSGRPEWDAIAAAFAAFEAAAGIELGPDEKRNMVADLLALEDLPSLKALTRAQAEHAAAVLADDAARALEATVVVDETDEVAP